MGDFNDTHNALMFSPKMSFLSEMGLFVAMGIFLLRVFSLHTLKDLYENSFLLFVTRDTFKNKQKFSNRK